MAGSEGEKPEFEQLDDLFAEDLPEGDPLAGLDSPAEADPLAEADLPSEGDPLSGLDAADDGDIESEAVEEDQSEDKSRKKKKRKKKPKKEKKKKTKLRKKDGLSVEDDEKEQGGGLLGVITNVDVFTVMLGVALLAIVIAVLCLWRELSGYDYQIKAQRPVVMAQDCGATNGPPDLLNRVA